MKRPFGLDNIFKGYVSLYSTAGFLGGVWFKTPWKINMLNPKNGRWMDDDFSFSLVWFLGSSRSLSGVYQKKNEKKKKSPIHPGSLT